MRDALIVSTFEGGYQPLTAMTATSALSAAGFDVDLLDIYVEGLNTERFKDADTIGISVPLFDSLNAGIQVAQQIRSANPSANIVFFGQYATINAPRLSGSYGDYTIAGEWEQPLTHLVKRLKNGGVPAEGIPGVVDSAAARAGQPMHPYLSRDHFRTPDRRFAPGLSKYPQPQIAKLTGENLLVGGLEATRGCHHKCTYCSVFAAYDGKVLIVPADVVIDDVRNLVAQGMTHLTFTDADFFNAKRHSVGLLRRLHEEFPALTYDFTTRVDHIVENPDLMREMAGLGVRFITSALEFPKQRVLDEVFKEVTVEVIEQSIALLRSCGVILNPTFIMFNPWIDLEDLVLFHEFVERNGLENVIDPIQYETRLHLYKGSPLLANPSIQALQLEEHEFHFDWKHPDPRVDELYLQSLTPVEEGVFKRCCLKC
jgi:radical SAM superfamily enzyme YgiQ (UPF0313 family)